MSPNPYSIVVLISGNGSNLQAIIDQVESGKINAKISAVISNRADVYGLERAKKAGIQAEYLDHGLFESREKFDRELQVLIDKYQPDLVVLAGFMRILSDAFVEHYHGRLINIHPSLLPAYRGLHTHKRALQDFSKGKIKNHGASVHFVIPELDAGTVIVQGVVPIETDDTEASLANRVHQVEHIIYPEAVKWLAEGMLRLESKKLFLDDELMMEPKKINFSE